MKIIINGTGRSGTTAIYTLIQEMLLDSGTKTDFIYEPFLRDKDYFNGRYETVTQYAHLMDSLSFEGIHHHLQLPLFIREPKLYKDNPYLKRLLQDQVPGPPGVPNQAQHILAKFIRANGRIALLQEICPDAKFIFIIRNPIDVINSIMERFSFYGGEFHTDDYRRFITAVRELYGVDSPIENLTNLEEKEFLFWYYMNRFALETIQLPHIAAQTLTICYENYLQAREHHLQKICEFLGFACDRKYLDVSRHKVGSITRKFVIPAERIELYQAYLDKYYGLAREFAFDIPVEPKEILGKYEIVKGLPPRTRPFYGLHTRAITRACEILIKNEPAAEHHKNPKR